MKCKEAAELLSAYIDNMLDAGQRTALEKHIEECASCRRELAELRSCLAGLKSMPKVTAPQDFLRGVHERIDEPSAAGKLIKKVFFPLRIKLPLELAGLMATVLLLFLFSDLVKEPQKVMQKQLAVQSGAVPVKTQPKPAAAALKEIKAVRKEDASVTESVVAKAKSTEQNFERQLNDESAERERVQSVDKLSLNYDALPGKTLNEPAEAPAPKAERRLAVGQQKSFGTAKSPLNAAGSAAVEAEGTLLSSNVQIALKTDDPEESNRKLGETVRKMKAQILKTEFNAATKKPEYTYISIPAEDYPAFFKELSNTAKIEGIPAGNPASASPGIVVRIQFIP